MKVSVVVGGAAAVLTSMGAAALEIRQAAPMHIVEPPAPRARVEAAPMHVQGEPGRQASAPAANGSPVRPSGAVDRISNGAAMNMPRDEIKRRFGDPGRKAGFPSCVLHYPNFTVETCGQDQRVSRMYLSGPGVQLGNGLGVGSSKADVARALGSPSGGQQGPYKIGVAYNGEQVSSIKIDYQPAPSNKPGNRPPSANYCGANCGFNPNTGQAAPTIYSPNSNYSPYGN